MFALTLNEQRARAPVMQLDKETFLIIKLRGNTEIQSNKT